MVPLSETTAQSSGKLSWLPSLARQPVRVFGTITTLIICGVCVLACTKGVVEGWTLHRWKQTYKEAFQGFINSIEAFTESEKRGIIQKPYILSRDRWKDFPGEPFTTLALYDSLTEMMVAVPLFLLIGVAQIVIYLSVLA